MSGYYCKSGNSTHIRPNANLVHTVSVLGQDEKYTVKYNPLPEGVPEGEIRGNSRRQRVIFDRIFQVES